MTNNRTTWVREYEIICAANFALIIQLPLCSQRFDDTYLSIIIVSQSLKFCVPRHGNNVAFLARPHIFISMQSAAVFWTMNAAAVGCQLYDEPLSFDRTLRPQQRMHTS